MIVFRGDGQIETIEGRNGAFRDYREEIRDFVPGCEQEEVDKRLLLQYMELFGEQILTRECTLAHLTASSMIFNRERDKVLMIYHKIYQSWAWTGGHSDGEETPLLTAAREALEETGIRGISQLRDGVQTLDILTVDGHWKRGAYVSSHLHLNLSYLFEADEGETLRIKEDENSGVQWIPVKHLADYVSEPEMIPVYEKLIRKAM